MHLCFFSKRMIVGKWHLVVNQSFLSQTQNLLYPNLNKPCFIVSFTFSMMYLTHMPIRFNHFEYYVVLLD